MMPKRPKDEPRTIQMPATRTTTRCALCGALIQSLDESSGKCGQCGGSLHSCKQCTHFDTSARYECQQPIPERIARKDAANQCTFLRDAGAGGARDHLGRRQPPGRRTQGV